MKTKLTNGRLSPTIITSQHNITTFLRLHFQEGIKGGWGERREEGHHFSETWSQLGKHSTSHCPECVMRQGRESKVARTTISTAWYDYNQYYQYKIYVSFMCQH